MSIGNPAGRSRSGFIFTAIGAVLALAGFGAVLFLGAGASAGGRSVSAGPSSDVVIATRDIAFRTVIQSGDVKVVKFALADVPPGAYTKVEEVKGLVPAIDLKKGDALANNLLVASGQATVGAQTAYLPIPTGFVALTIPTGEQQGVAGYISAGDYISVIVVITPKGSTFATARTVFTNIHVLRVGPSTGDVPTAGGASQQKTGGVASSLTVVVTQCQAEYINWFLSNAALKYTLESHQDYKPQDTSVDASCPSVTAANGVTDAAIKSRWPGLLG